MTAALSPAARRSFPLFIAGLSLKQILAWGTTYYLPSILEGSIARELGLGRGVIFGGVTLMLLVAAVIAPRAGRHIDAHGVRGPMLLGSLSLSAGLCLLGLAQGPVSYLAGWVLFGVAVPLTMSIAAFAAVAQAFPERGRSGITVLMLFGGLSSGVMWPLTGWLDAELGWRMTCFVYAALQIGVALPVAHWLVVDTRKAGSASEAARHAIQPRLPEEARSKGFALLVIGSGVSGLVSWGLPLYFVPMFREAGLAAGLAILLASLQAYFTLSARLFDLAVSARLGGMRLVSTASLISPVVFVLLLWAGTASFPPGLQAILIGVAVAIYGFAAGMISQARATLPLELFGSGGFATMLGRLSRWLNLMFACSPLLFAFIYDSLGAAAANWTALVLSLVAALAFWRLDRLVGPRKA